MCKSTATPVSLSSKTTAPHLAILHPAARLPGTPLPQLIFQPGASSPSSEKCTVLIFTSQLRKLKSLEVKGLSQGHRMSVQSSPSPKPSPVVHRGPPDTDLCTPGTPAGSPFQPPPVHCGRHSPANLMSSSLTGVGPPAGALFGGRALRGQQSRRAGLGGRNRCTDLFVQPPGQAPRERGEKPYRDS